MTVLRDAEVKLRNNSIFYYCFKKLKQNQDVQLEFVLILSHSIQKNQLNME